MEPYNRMAERLIAESFVEGMKYKDVQTVTALAEWVWGVLDAEGLFTEEQQHPKILTTGRQVEDLDPDTVVVDRDGHVEQVKAWLDPKGRMYTGDLVWLPAVVLSTGLRVRECEEHAQKAAGGLHTDREPEPEKVEVRRSPDGHGWQVTMSSRVAVFRTLDWSEAMRVATGHNYARRWVQSCPA